MKQNCNKEVLGYIAPEIEIDEVSVENGFAQSPGYFEGGAGSYDDFLNDNGSY